MRVGVYSPRRANRILLERRGLKDEAKGGRVDGPSQTHEDVAGSRRGDGCIVGFSFNEWDGPLCVGEELLGGTEGGFPPSDGSPRFWHRLSPDPPAGSTSPEVIPSFDPSGLKNKIPPFHPSFPPDIVNKLSWLPETVAPFGDISEIHLSSAPNAPLLIHLQDAHEIEEAQGKPCPSYRGPPVQAGNIFGGNGGRCGGGFPWRLTVHRPTPISRGGSPPLF
jgi:hypothetical protein